MKRKELEFVVHRRREGSLEQVNIEMRFPDGTRHTYNALDQVPEQYRSWVEKFLQPVPDELELLPPLPELQTDVPVKKSGIQKKKVRPLRLTHYWFDLWAVTGALILLLYSYWMARHVFSGRDPWAWWVILCILGMLAGGYLALVFLVNRTTLQADKKGLTVQHGPLPLRQSVFVPRSELYQLFVRVHTGRYTRYSLCALTANGIQTLIHEEYNPSELRRIEEMIEDRLGIVDQPVSGNQYR